MAEARRVTPMEMPPEAASLELRLLDRALELLKARRSGLATHVEAMLKRGQRVPGWRVGPGESRERWTVPPAHVIAVGEALHLKLAKPVESLTPRQAREAGLDPAIVAAMAERGAPAMKLEEDDGTAARKVFG